MFYIGNELWMEGEEGVPSVPPNHTGMVRWPSGELTYLVKGRVHFIVIHGLNNSKEKIWIVGPELRTVYPEDV